MVRRGFTALKTNIWSIPGDPATVYFPGFASGINTTDGAPTVEILEAIDRPIGTFRGAVGPKVGLLPRPRLAILCTEGVLRIAKLLEQYDMQWLEYDNWDPDALLQIKQSTSTRPRLLREPGDAPAIPALPEKHAVDVAINRRAVERLLPGRADRAASPRPARDQYRAPQLLQPSSPTCTPCTSARCCPMSASWKSISTTCPGRARW